MKKQGKSLNLSSVKVDIEDADPNSSYFVVSNFNGTFFSGKNAFYVNGSNLLKNNSEIFIEVLDAGSLPVLVESDKKVFTNNSGVIYSVNIYDVTSNGVGKIILLGTDINGRKVRWTSNVEINNKKINSSEVTFRKIPSMEVTPFINLTSETNISEISIVGKYRGFSLVPKENSSVENVSPDSIKYLIEVSDSTTLSSDMNGEKILLDGEERIIKEVINSKRLLINYPLTNSSGITKNRLMGNFEIKYFPFNTPSEISINELKPIGTAEITFKNLETYTGKVYRYKIYRSSINAQYDSECISSGFFFGYELVYDSETPFRYLAELGKIVNEDSLLNWRVISTSNIPAIRHSPEIMIDSLSTNGFREISNSGNGLLLKIYSSGFVDSSNGYIDLLENLYSDRSSETFRSNSIRFYKNIEYVLSFKITCEKNVGRAGKLKVYIKSSDPNMIKNQGFDGFGIKIYEFEMHSMEIKKNLFEVKQTFYLNEDIKGTIFIELNGLDITVSNISIKPYTDFSYGPDVFNIRIPVDARAKNEGVKFSAELFDINNNLVFCPEPLVDIKYLDPDGVTYPFNSTLLRGEFNSALQDIQNELDLTNQNYLELSQSISNITIDLNAANVIYNNESFPTVELALNHLLYEPLELLYFNGGGVYETGSVVNSVSLEWEYNKQPTYQSLSNASITLESRQYVGVSEGITSNRTYVLNYTDGVTNGNSSRAVSFLQKRYWGTSTSTSLSNSDILNLSSELSSTKNQTKNFNCSGGAYFYFAWPSSFGLGSFTVFGLTNNDFTLTTRNFTNSFGYTSQYHIYRCNNLQFSSNIPVTVT